MTQPGASTNAGGPADALPGPSWLLRVHARWPQARLWGLAGTAAVLLGGCVAAASAPAHSELGAWAGAYLVLVGGMAQVGIGIGQVVLAREPHSRVVGEAQVLLWNGGTVVVIAGTAAGAPAVGDVGGLMLVVVLVLSVRAVRNAVGGAAWLHRALLAVLAVGVVVGQVLARVHPLG
jgi:hypothetical protein